MKVTNCPRWKQLPLHLASSIPSRICAVTEKVSKSSHGLWNSLPTWDNSNTVFLDQRRQHKGYLCTLPVAMLLVADGPDQRPKFSDARPINMGRKIAPGTKMWVHTGLGCPSWNSNHIIIFFSSSFCKNTSQIAMIWIQAYLFSCSLSHIKVQCHNAIPQHFFSNCDLEWWWNCWQMVVLHFKTVSSCNTKEVTAPEELQGQVAREAPPVPLEPACQNSAEAEKMSCDQYV